MRALDHREEGTDAAGELVNKDGSPSHRSILMEAGQKEYTAWNNHASGKCMENDGKWINMVP